MAHGRGRNNKREGEPTNKKRDKGRHANHRIHGSASRMSIPPNVATTSRSRPLFASPSSSPLHHHAYPHHSFCIHLAGGSGFLFSLGFIRAEDTIRRFSHCVAFFTHTRGHSIREDGYRGIMVWALGLGMGMGGTASHGRAGHCKAGHGHGSGWEGRFPCFSFGVGWGKGRG